MMTRPIRSWAPVLGDLLFLPRQDQVRVVFRYDGRRWELIAWVMLGDEDPDTGPAQRFAVCDEAIGA